MAKGKSEAPDAPNYQSLAKAQGEEERKTAGQITAANRPTQLNPYGNLTWQQDDAGNWTQTENWDPRIKSVKDQSLAMQNSMINALRKRDTFSGPESIKYDPNAGDAMSDALYESVMGRTRVEQGRERDAIDTKLRQQGLQPGTEAYDRAMKNVMTSQGDVSAKAALDARLAGGQEARQEFGARTTAQQNEYGQKLNEYQMPWEELSRAQGAEHGVQAPQFQGFSGATGYQPADMLGAAQQQYATAMGQTNAQNAKKGNIMSGGIGAAGSIWGG